jgi:hypothetical protein
MLKSIIRDPFLLIPAFLGALLLFVIVTVFVALTNKALGTDTVIETFPGTKSVCVRQQFNYSLKVTQCVEHKSVPAICQKKELIGPFFDPIIHTECE